MLPKSEGFTFYVEPLSDARTPLAECFSILLYLLHVEQCQAGSQPCSRQDSAMHPKRGKLFNRFFPADVESMGSSKLTELGWADDERMASFPKNSADPLQAFS